MIYYLLFIAIINVFSGIFCQDQSWQNSPFFDIKILKNRSYTEQLLTENGFQKSSYVTDDGLTLPCLIKQKNNAKATIVIYVGCAGRITDGAPLAAMLADQPYNLLFVGGRNNISSWRLRPQFLQLGNYSFLDIKGAVCKAHDISSAPIVILGICAGSYYALRMLATYNTVVQEMCIKGIIVDSGWHNQLTTARSVVHGFVTSKLDKAFGNNGYYLAEKPLTRPLWQRILIRGAQAFAGFMSIFYEPLLYYETKKFNLLSLAHTITLPIFFIHAANDYLTNISEIKTFANAIAKHNSAVTTWWVEDSKHACMYLKHKQEYKEKIINFIENTL